MRLAILPILAGLFLIAPPVLHPVFYVAITLMLSTAWLDGLLTAQRMEARRGMMIRQIRSQNSSLALSR